MYLTDLKKYIYTGLMILEIGVFLDSFGGVIESQLGIVMTVVK